MKILTVGAILLSCTIIGAVGMGASGCGPAHKASVAAASIGTGLQTAAQVNHDTAAAGLETIEERQLIAGYIEQAAKANDAFIRTLQTIEANGGQPTGAQVVADFTTLEAQIDTLEAQGVLHLKSAAAQQKFALVMSSIKASIAVIQAITAVQSSENRGSHGNPFAPLLAGGLLVGLTPALIEEALSLGTQLVTALTKLKGESDAQLQAQGLQSDAAAETQAEADEKPV